MMHFVRHWHARLGVLAAVFFLLLALSGFALNHTDALGLAKRDVNTAWLMRWYGLKTLLPTHGYLFKDGYLAVSGERWIMDGQVLAAHEAKQALVGAATWGDMRAVATADSLYLYTPDGQLVDKLTGASLPNGLIKHLAVIASDVSPQLVLQTTQGDFLTNDGLAWQVLSVEKLKAFHQPVWVGEQALPDSLLASLSVALAPSLPLERIVLDLHSGRIFGCYGPMVMDSAAIGLILLSLSGVWIYIRTTRRQKRH